MKPGSYLDAAGRISLLVAAVILVATLSQLALGPVIVDEASARRERMLRSVVPPQTAYLVSPPVFAAAPPVTAVAEVRDGGDTLAGLAVLLEPDGYGGSLELVAYYRPDGELLTARFFGTSENRGLGWPVFRPVRGVESIAAADLARRRDGPVRDSSLPEAMAGATVTHAAIVSGLQAGSDYVRARGAGVR